MLKKFNLKILLIINILVMFIESILIKSSVIKYINLSYSFYVLLIINTISIIIKRKKDKIKINIYDILTLLIIIFGVISTIFAYDKKISILGFHGRYEGLLSILYYLSLFIMSTFIKKKDKKLIINFILFTGIASCFYAILQLCGVSFVRIIKFQGRLWYDGLQSNPNFFGSYVLLCILYALGLFIDEENKIKQITYCICLIILLYGLFLCNTTSCALAFLIIFIYSMIWMIRKKYYKKIISIIVIILSFGLLFYNSSKSTQLDDLVKTKNEIQELSRGNVDGYFGSKRIDLWKKTLDLSDKYLLHGVGIDNFYYIDNGNPIKVWRYSYDKAHNEYLQILITQGLFSLLVYLLLYISVLFIKRKDNKKKEIYLMLPPVGYLIQAFFNISVIETAPIFFISLGLLTERYLDNQLYKDEIKRVLDVVVSSVSIILLLPLYLLISILIILIDHNKPLFIQPRTGINGNVFNIFKFRTVKNNKSTKLGNFLRNTSLDETLQFFNVLFGDMSIVGPRPWIVDYYEKLDTNQKRRVTVYPGIVGLASVNGRNNIGIIKKINYDLEYIDNISFKTDLKIILDSFKWIFIKEDFESSNKNIKKELRELDKNRKKHK